MSTMNSGVPKGKLYMEEYNPEWAVLGRDLVARLKGVIKKAVDIRHVGSTAVVGIIAKPLIDIAVGVRRLDDITEYIDELEAMDIHYAGEAVPRQREFYIDDKTTGRRLVHIHVIIWGKKKWNDYINVVDYLNADERARQAYIHIKKACLLLYSDHPELYGPAKHIFMEDLCKFAYEWRDRQNGMLS